MTLPTKYKQQLKAQAHKLKPIVLIGNNGLTEAVQNEIEHALNDHELIKIKVAAKDRESKREIIHNVCQERRAELVQIIGNIGVIYRKNIAVA